MLAYCIKYIQKWLCFNLYIDSVLYSLYKHDCFAKDSHKTHVALELVADY